MEFQRFQVHIHLRLGIILLLLAGISFCKHSSSDFPKLGSYKYITEAYFQNHDTLIDHVFQDFITNGLPHSSCKFPQEKDNFAPKLSVLHRHLIGEGSHRRLTSSLKIEIPPQILSNSCEAIIIERLPSGVFADPFELQHLTQRGVFSDASAFGDTDLELPTVRANRSVIEIHMDLNPNTFSENKNSLQLNIKLPLHARYAPLGEQGYTRVEFGSPDLFLRCVSKEESLNESCIFSSTINCLKSEEASAIIWEVPSGITKHTEVVSVVTFISAVVSAFSIFIACVYYSNPESYSSSKQS